MSQIVYLKTACERCSGHIEYPSELAGQSIECPHCHQATPLPPPLPPSFTTPTPIPPPTSECEEIATTINRLVEAGHMAKAQDLLELALEEYFVLQLAMFANTKVNASVTIAEWKQAGLRLPAEDTDEFYSYRDSPSVTKEQLKAEFDKLKEEPKGESEPEQVAGGYWRAVAEHFISAQLNKPFFGRPHLKLGQCFGLWGSLFGLGGILGQKHRAKLDAFVPAFVGLSGEAGTAQRFLVAVANKLLDRHSLNSMKHWDFVAADLGDRVSDYKRDDWSSLLMERGTDEIPPDVAAKNAWFYASNGAALGAISPNVVRAMFERTFAPVSKERWQQMYASGLDIGPGPPALRSYEQAEEEENKFFMEYCRQFRPDLYPVLND